MMRWTLFLLPALGCGGGDTTGVEEDDLVGTWEATEYKLFDFGDPVREFDLIAAGGSATIVFEGDGTFQLALAGAEPALTTGSWALQGDHQLILTESGAAEGTLVDVSLWTTVLILGCDEWEFDFDEGPVPAQLSALFVPD
jgi:hypothetical protein